MAYDVRCQASLILCRNLYDSHPMSVMLSCCLIRRCPMVSLLFTAKTMGRSPCKLQGLLPMIAATFYAYLFCPFNCCSSVLIIKKHPRIADSTHDSRILPATIQEYSATLFVPIQAVVAFDAYDESAVVPGFCVNGKRPLSANRRQRPSHTHQALFWAIIVSLS